MKSNNTILMAICTVFVLATSCDLAEKIQDQNQEQKGPVEKVPKYEFTALVSAQQIMPDAYDIKNPYYFSWEEGFELSCYSSQEDNIKMELVSGKFTYRGKFRFTTSKALKDVDDYVMVYPYSENGPLADGTFHGTLPAIQSNGNLDTLQAMSMLVKATFDTYGTSEVAACTMNRPCAILRVPVTGNGETLKSISVVRVDSAAIAGDFVISDFSTMEPVFDQNQSRSITYILPEPLKLTTTPATVDIVVPAATFKSGLNIILNADDGSSDNNVISGPITFTHGLINKVKTANFGKYLIWSSGFLMIDETGFRFSNSDVNGGDRTVGMYFKYKSIRGLDAGEPDIVVNPNSYNKDSVKVWGLDSLSSTFGMKVKPYAEVTEVNVTDPCTLVPVKEGEPSWVLPTLAQLQVWAKKDLTLNKHNQVLSVSTDPRNRFNNENSALNTGVKTIYGIYEAVTSKVIVYRSGYIDQTGQKATGTDNFCYMWYDTGSDSDLKVFGLAVNNSTTKQLSVNANCAAQIRCCREVDDIEEEPTE